MSVCLSVCLVRFVPCVEVQYIFFLSFLMTFIRYIFELLKIGFNPIRRLFFYNLFTFVLFCRLSSLLFYIPMGVVDKSPKLKRLLKCIILIFIYTTYTFPLELKNIFKKIINRGILKKNHFLLACLNIYFL